MRVQSLWRYPVKSMQGEQLRESEATKVGFEGDRERAVVDMDTGVSLSAKRYGQLLLCRSWTTDEQVMIALPDGTEFPADSSSAAKALSALLHRNVTIKKASTEHEVAHEFPADIPTGEGEPFIWKPGLQRFWDRAPVHLITTATLFELGRIRPHTSFDIARFRPNFVVETQEKGFLEDRWVGKDLTAGAIRCRVVDRKPRCVMTTREQGTLAKDSNVLKTIAKSNDGNVGVELQVLEPGTLKVGDEVAIEKRV